MHLAVVHHLQNLQFNCLNENIQLSLRHCCSFLFTCVSHSHFNINPHLSCNQITLSLSLSFFFTLFSFAASVVRQPPPPDPEFINPASVPNPVPVRRKAGTTAPERFAGSWLKRNSHSHAVGHDNTLHTGRGCSVAVGAFARTLRLLIWWSRSFHAEAPPYSPTTVVL